MTNLNAWKQNRIRVLRTLFNENGAIAGSGPMSLLAGIGVLGLIFFTGLGVDRQSAQTVSMLQEDPLVQAVQQAVQLGQKEESERACIYWRIDKHGHFTTTLSRRDFY
ncbi:hypothetical protein [Leptospirillum ferriphilum]|uniref:hypothetical protein n=1 Tax=Leptospirillum ferriphilum TaxID=178606 RepID=UPI0005A1CCDA|nr:hypothetical protein [Leptospirillum ferriphilum]